MAKSKGVAMGRGYSKGPYGHGGVHHKGGAVTSHGSNSPKTDHMRDMMGRSDQTMHGGNFQSGAPGI